MILSTKIYDASASKIPLEVMKEALEECKNKEPKVVVLQEPGTHPSLFNTAGLLKNVRWENDVELWGDVELAPTPKGKIIEEFMEMGTHFKFVPQFLATFNENKEIEKIEFVSVNITSI